MVDIKSRILTRFFTDVVLAGILSVENIDYFTNCSRRTVHHKWTIPKFLPVWLIPRCKAYLDKTLQTPKRSRNGVKELNQTITSTKTRPTLDRCDQHINFCPASNRSNILTVQMALRLLICIDASRENCAPVINTRTDGQNDDITYYFNTIYLSSPPTEC